MSAQEDRAQLLAGSMAAARAAVRIAIAQVESTKDAAELVACGILRGALLLIEEAEERL